MIGAGISGMVAALELSAAGYEVRVFEAQDRVGAIDGGFSPVVKRAVEAAVPLYIPAVKIAFQADRRWWEQDHRIYGGISWTTRDITQMWYPSSDLHAPRGILVGAYIWTHGIGNSFSAMTPARRTTCSGASRNGKQPA